MKDDFNPFFNLWTTAYDFHGDNEEWHKSYPFIKLQYAVVQKKIDDYWKNTVKY